MKSKKCTGCSHCEARKQEEHANEEFSMAVLVSLVPMLVFTLFGQIGLF
ncbi:MAG: hypothetical protein WCJ51_01050 [Candidatus Moraniibacteriota bacterium]